MGLDDFQSMSDLPESLRSYLSENTSLVMPKIIDQQTSAAEDTVKLLLELADGERIEMVLSSMKRWASS